MNLSGKLSPRSTQYTCGRCPRGDFTARAPPERRCVRKKARNLEEGGTRTSFITRSSKSPGSFTSDSSFSAVAKRARTGSFLNNYVLRTTQICKHISRVLHFSRYFATFRFKIPKFFNIIVQNVAECFLDSSPKKI